MKQYLKDLISEACTWKSLTNPDKFQYKVDEQTSRLFCLCDYCGEYFEILEIRSRKITNEKHYHSYCYRKTEEYAEMRRNAMQKNKGEGKCSVCGKWNKHRDQNQRGKDGIENNGCNCSGEFYKKHNSSEKMVKLSISKLEELNKDPNRLKDLQYGKEQKCKHGNIFRAHTKEELESKCRARCKPVQKIKQCKHGNRFRVRTEEELESKCKAKCILKDSQHNKIKQCKHGNRFRARTEEELESKCRARCELKDYQKIKKCEHGNRFRAHTEEELESKCKAKCYCRKCNTLLPKHKLGRLCDKCYRKSGRKSFIEENNCELHKDICNVSYHIGNKEYLCWECFKEKFQINNESLPMDNYDFIGIPTFRTQESDSWAGARNAFESYLVENNITWFVYIKYYIDAYAASRPLVVGKTGSRLVNINGTDVSFSTDITDGLARIFLYENNLTWDKTKISIIRCDSEQQALKIEKEILEKFGLFSS